MTEKLVLVTGACGEIGQALIQGLAHKGLRVVRLDALLHRRAYLASCSTGRPASTRHAATGMMAASIAGLSAVLSAVQWARSKMLTTGCASTINAIIVGPAILAPLERVEIRNSSFEGDPDALFIEIPEGRGVIGVIGLKNVEFDDCEFRNIGIAGTPESISRFRAGLASG